MSEEAKTTAEVLDPIRQMNIYEKIQAVSNEVGVIAKNITVGKGSYAYKAVSDVDVTAKVKAAETKYRLVSIPIHQEHVSSEVIKAQDEKGKERLTHVDNIRMTISIINLDNTEEEVQVTTFGKGIDPADKGFGKASTYARKYGLLNAYKIPTGEDPDENKSEAITRPKTPDEKRVEVLNYFGMNIETAASVCKHFEVNEIKDLDDKQVAKIHATYTKKGLL